MLSYQEFLKAMIIHLSAVREHGTDETLTLEAREYLDDFLAQSGIEYGDKDFDWSDAGAYTLVSEYTSYD